MNLQIVILAAACALPHGVARMSRRDRGQMPQLATTKIDEAGAAVIRRWIEQLKNDDEPGKGGTNGRH